MTDPRNVAHDKKVHQPKNHQNIKVAPGADKADGPGKESRMERQASDIAKTPDETAPIHTHEKPLD